MRMSKSRISTNALNHTNKNSFQKLPGQEMLKLLFVFLNWFFLLPVNANTVWIKSPQTSLLDFKAHIEALGSPHIPYGEYQLSQRRKAAQSFKLMDHIQKAQELYLSGTIPSAKKAFQNIIQMAHSADWDKKDRRIILYAFLRSAQLEEQPDIKRAFLLSAVQFLRNPITAQQEDYTLFPPPLTKTFNTLLKNQVFFTVNWKKIFPEHELILINGEKIATLNSTQIPEGVYRITALSSSHAPWSQTVSLSRLLSRSVHTKALTTGACHTLKIASQWKNPSVRLLSPDCPAPLKFTEPNNLSKDIPSSLNDSALETDLPEKPEISQKLKVPKWLWIVGGVAAASLLIYWNSPHAKKKSPPVVIY